MSFLLFRSLGRGLPFGVLSKTSIILVPLVSDCPYSQSLPFSWDKARRIYPQFQKSRSTTQLSFLNPSRPNPRPPHRHLPSLYYSHQARTHMPEWATVLLCQTSAKAAQKGSIFLSEISLIPLHSNQTWNIFKLSNHIPWACVMSQWV